MKHRIDPKIDCVFKALLGSETNRNLLIHFLNAVLGNELSAPVVAVEILNPYNDKEFFDDKLSIVDVKAEDNQGRLYQVEIQLLAYSNLPSRILYTWCDIYSQQLQSGDDYHLLKPTYSIWLLAENLIKDDAEYSHEYKLRDRQGRILIEHGSIHILELKKFFADTVKTEEQRWLRFFKDGERLDDAELPDWMNTPEMRQAMSTLKRFSEKDRDYHAYQARQNYLREQRTIQWEWEQDKEKLKLLENVETELRQKEENLRQKEEDLRQKEEELRQERFQKQEALQREQATQAEIERLKALLATKNP